MNQLLMYIPFVALAIGYTVWMRKKAASAVVNSRPAAIDYFSRTGYCYADRLGMPPEVQADRSLQEMNEMTALGAKQGKRENYEHVTHYVRDYHGLRMHFRSAFGGTYELTKSTTYRSAAWTAEIPAPPRVPVHIADKSLVGLGKAVGEMFSNTTRHFTPQAPNKVETGIPAVDGKFVVFGHDPVATREIFQKNPALVEMLQNWAALDVAVTQKGAVFNDPTQENMTAAMGGMVGNMALGFDIGKRLELSIPVHDRASDLLLALVRATA